MHCQLNSRLPDGQAPYKLSLKEEEACRREVEEGLKSGNIVPSTAPNGCPVMFVGINRTGH
jgi:hypothetical protein